MIVKLIVKMCAVVLGAALFLQTPAISAELITADQTAPINQSQADRIKVQNFMDRAEVKDRLQSYGVTETISKMRVAAMTDEEVHVMAQKIDTMPAGGRIHDSDLVVVLLLVILLILLI